MGFDFSADSKTIINEFANCEAQIGIDTIPGIFTTPGRTVELFGGGVESAAPSVVIQSAAAVRLELAYDTPVTIDGVDYLANEPQHDDAGLALVTLRCP